MGKAFEPDYGRVPERVWIEPWFATLSDKAKLLYLCIATTSIGAPQATGLAVASQAVMADRLGWDAVQVGNAAEELIEANAIIWEPDRSTWWAPGNYFEPTNASWAMGRVRKLAKMPPSKCRSYVLLKAVRNQHLEQRTEVLLDELNASALVDWGEANADTEKLSKEAKARLPW